MTRPEPKVPAGIVMPVRDEYAGHMCRCELVKGVTADHVDVDGNVTTRTIRDRCGQWVADPEQIICDDCKASGHDDLPEWRIRPAE